MNEKMYCIHEQEENVWAIVSKETNQIINLITKEIIIDYCNQHPDFSIEIVSDIVRDDMISDYDLDLIDNYGDEYDKFLAWFDYTCIEYLATEIIANYKQRLLDFE